MLKLTVLINPYGAASDFKFSCWLKTVCARDRSTWPLIGRSSRHSGQTLSVDRPLFWALHAQFIYVALEDCSLLDIFCALPPDGSEWIAISTNSCTVIIVCVYCNVHLPPLRHAGWCDPCSTALWPGVEWDPHATIFEGTWLFNSWSWQGMLCVIVNCGILYIVMTTVQQLRVKFKR